MAGSRRWAGLPPAAFPALILATLVARPAPAAAGSDPAPLPVPAFVEGILVDKKSGEPVAGALVRLDGGPPVVSGADGRYEFPTVSAGPHEITVEDPDHAPFRIGFRVESGARRQLRTAMDPVGLEEQEEVVVKADRLREEITNTPLTMDEVKKIPGTQGDVLKIVQSLPGVARGMPFSLTAAGPGLLIQGAAPGDSQVLIDGHPAPLLYHFMGLTSILNSDLLQSIDFLPSGYGAEYGQAIGGIIDVRTKSTLAKNFGGYVNASLIDAGFLLQGPIGDQAGFEVAARRSTVDAWLPSLTPHFSGLELTVAPVYYDYQAKLDWIPRSSSHFSLLVFGSSDQVKLLRTDANVTTASGTSTVQDQVQFHRLQLGWDYAPSLQFELRTSLMAGYEELDFELGEDRYLLTQIMQLEARSDGHWQPVEAFTLGFGLRALASYDHGEQSLRRTRLEGEVLSSRSEQPILVGTRNQVGTTESAYLQAMLSPIQGSLLIAAARFEFYGPPLNRSALMPRFSASQELRPGTTLSASVGLHVQPPTLDQLSAAFGQPDLDLERAWHFALRLKQALPLAASLDFEVFTKTLDRLVVYDPVKTYSNAGIGRISGIEVMLRREFMDGFFGWLAYTLMRSERKDGPGQPWRLFDYDQTHILTLVAGYHLATGPVQPRLGIGDGWDFGLRFQLVSGNPTTPIIGSIYDADNDTYLRIAGPVNSQRLPLYHRLDLRVDYTWAWTRFAFSLYLDLQNVYNYQSIEGIEYNYDYSQSAYRRGLPIIPGLGLKGSF